MPSGGEATGQKEDTVIGVADSRSLGDFTLEPWPGRIGISATLDDFPHSLLISRIFSIDTLL